MKAKAISVIRFLQKILFPPKCAFCERTMEPNVKLLVCGGCGDSIEFCFDSVCCEKCGKPILSFGKKKLCYFCLNHGSKYFDRIVSVFLYEGNAQKAILRFKAKGLSSQCEVFSNLLALRISEEYLKVKFDFICGAPPYKKSKRGFDPVELLCKSISKKLEIPYTKDIFKTTRKRNKQSSLSFRMRLENMHNSLKVKDNFDIDGKTVLLIDDVCTTRATIMECSRALKAKGANHVYAATVATVMNNEKI